MGIEISRYKIIVVEKLALFIPQRGLRGHKSSTRSFKIKLYFPGHKLAIDFN